MERTTADTADNRKGHAASSPWQMPWAGWKEVLVRTSRQSSEDNVSIVAAAVAFYGFLAMVPMMGAIILIYGLAADPQTVVSHANSLTGVLPQEVARLIGEQLLNVVTTSEAKKGLGLLLAIAVALWGARNAASSIITALNIAYEEQEKRGFVRVTLLSLTMTAAAVAMALLGGVAIAVLGALEHLLPGLGPIGVVLGKVLAYALLGSVAAAAAASMYRYGPSRDRAKWTWLTPGSLFFAVVWIMLTLAFGFYVSQFGNYGATYGSLSAVVVLLTWLYLSSFVLLLGAELNSELEHQTARDTTRGGEQPLGARGAWAADNVAGGGASQDEDPEAPPPADQPRAREFATAAPAPDQSEHPYLASRVTARAAQAAGLRKVGMASSVLATIGLAQLGRRGSEGTGAMLLLSAAGLSLLRRRG
ncbi:MAG TPA: YihY/virulence factor BrkB family protein [Sphingomicrobium sp.]|nr:YihY/virulence factor BrkB family protein [Sphingomicrobium sp.]